MINQTLRRTDASRGTAVDAANQFKRGDRHFQKKTFRFATLLCSRHFEHSAQFCPCRSQVTVTLQSSIISDHCIRPLFELFEVFFV